MRAIEKTGETENQALGRIELAIEIDGGTFILSKANSTRLTSQVDISTGAILLQVEFPNPNSLLRPVASGIFRTIRRARPRRPACSQRAVTDVQGKSP